MPTPIRVAPVALVVAVSLAAFSLVACGGGHHSYKAGTPAATGVSPSDCSLVPLDLVTTTLKLSLTGPSPGSRPGGVTCAFQHTKGGGSAPEVVQFGGNVTDESFHIVRNGLKSANNPVKTIHGWGDDAYAFGLECLRRAVVGGGPMHIRRLTDHEARAPFDCAVRKGKVSVVIQSTADYPQIRNLMKAVLAKL